MQHLPHQTVKQIDALIGSDVLSAGSTGALIESLRDGNILYESDSHRVFMPASVMKLLTSAAILDALGPDYRFRTELLASSAPQDGVIAGDIFLKGYGDSTMSLEDLEEIAQALKSQGIVRISGNLLVDDTYFDDVRMGCGWSWDYQSDYYAAQISSLILERNTIGVTVEAANHDGEPAKVLLSPLTELVEVQNEATTSPAGTESTIEIERIRARNIIHVTGQIACGSEAVQARITVEDPAVYVGDIFKSILQKHGISVHGGVAHGVVPQGGVMLHCHQSRPLSEILPLLNKPSDNLIAECLFKSLGAELKGHGTRDNAAAALMEFIQKIGGNTKYVNIGDGSGLSRINMISARNIVAILKYMARSPYAEIYRNSLPLGGVDGSFTDRFKGTLCERNVCAKPGFIGWVTTIAGYVQTKDGEPLVFALLSNNFLCTPEEVRGIHDRILLALANLPGDNAETEG